MKLIKILTALIALASLQIAAAQWLEVPPPVEAKMLMVQGGVPVVAVEECVGNTDTAGISWAGDWNNTAIGNDSGNYFVAPGSGTRTVTKIGAYLKNEGATTSIRFALYDSSYALICQGNAAKSYVSSAAAWVYQTSSASELTGTCTVTGDNNYRVVMTQGIENAAAYSFVGGGAADSNLYKVGADYTTGFPDPLTGVGTYTNVIRLQFCVQ
jgi:hypothetical protein